MGVTNGVRGAGVGQSGERALCCPAWAPLLGFVPSAELVVGTWHLTDLHKLWVNLDCRAAVFSFIFVSAQRDR